MEDREWMYTGWQHGRAASSEWIQHTTQFVEHAFSNPSLVEGDTIKCPCASCRNYSRQNRHNVQMHLSKLGFMKNYKVWAAHGESVHRQPNAPGSSSGHKELEGLDRMDNMLTDLVADRTLPANEEPIASARAFYRMVDGADELVHENTKHSSLSAIARLLAAKSRHNMSIANFDEIMEIIHELLPEEAKLPEDFYHSKKMLEGLGMPYVKIDVCYKNCMLYWKDDEHKVSCDFCGTSRYKEGPNRVPRKVLRYLPLIDRLQRLYAHEEIAKLMRSHCPSTSRKMVHPCDGEAWQKFDEDYRNFARDPRNVRLCIATDGFTPFNMSAASYSCWPVFVSPLNLPPGTLLKSEYIFLSLVIPGPEHPGKNLNILMQPLVDDLMKLWQGVDTWDSASKRNFKMRAAFLWSVHDFPAYGIFSGWSTHGALACPVCGSQLKAFRLQHGHKPCWFDCHRRFLPRGHEFRFQANAFRKDTTVFEEAPRCLTGQQVEAEIDRFVGNTKAYGKLHNWTHKSCFWQLPYYKKLKLRHNIDLMHNEKNLGEAIFNTCLDISGKTKDNVKARKDLADICNRPRLNLEPMANGKWYKPRAQFCISKDDKIIVLKWFQKLMFPDGYAANIKRGVNLSQRKIFGLKSHDWHIFMERLLPVAFRGFLPENIWKCLAELSFFYRQLCAKELSKDAVDSMEQSIVVLLCKLEKIFPPGFFNPMQHLIMHLPYEARLGGPVQARWMYTYEREIYNLKKKVGNKSQVEGSIVEAYLVQEATNFLSLYFRPGARSVRNKAPRYDDGASTFQSTCNIDMFQYPGRCISPRSNRYLREDEYKIAFLYILTNMSEMDGLFEKFTKEQWKSRIRPTEKHLRDLRLNGWKSGINFFDWFKNQCMMFSTIPSALRHMSYGFRTKVASYGCYDINGYRFRSSKYESEKSGLTTTNTGVCVASYDEKGGQLEYYGVINDIIKVTWEGSMQLELVLFDCHWFDPTSAGVRRTENLGLVEIMHSSRLTNYDPFVLASQVTQVYYLPYACNTIPDLSKWWVAYHVPRHGYVPPHGINTNPNPVEAQTQQTLFYQEDGLPGSFVIDLGDDFDMAPPFISDEVTDPKDLEFLQKQNADPEEDDEETDEDEDESSDEDGEPDPPTYDPNDF